MPAALKICSRRVAPANQQHRRGGIFVENAPGKSPAPLGAEYAAPTELGFELTKNYKYGAPTVLATG